MKKLLLLTVLFLAFACSKDDEGDTSGGTDPFVGTWQGQDSGETHTFIVRPDGTVTVSFSVNGITNDDDNEYWTWRNTSSNPNFNSLTQTYIFDEGLENENTSEVTYGSDFNTFTCSDCPLYTRQ